ncbi:OLC1v1003238C1 [Oldenlandia corymbosa var. corymbosa]|uniref:OLC1v1003238C1 n=1 Tax=Oldenlandia corymbosa var. corymbosa TaxID=529605 RepID=A0AAV1DBY7_OLDCO|nr:OLC1v1003238C1 [Oldenlandia corymbosa var. corymbosa]
MSEHFAYTRNNSAGNSRQSMHSYHSDWMSHWTQRNKESDRVSIDYPSTSGKETASNACSPARGPAGISPGCSKMKIKGLRKSSPIAGKGTRTILPVPMGDSNSNGESTSNTRDRHAASDLGALRAHHNKHNLDFNSTALSLKCYTATPLAVVPDANRNPSKDGHFEAEGTSDNTKEHVKTYPFLGNSSYTLLRPLSKDLNVSSTEMMQHRSDKMNELLPFFPSRVGRPALAPEEHLPVTNPSSLDSVRMNFQRHSTFLARDDKLECHSKAGRCLPSNQQQKNASLSETEPCKFNSRLPEASQHKFQEKHNASGIRIFWNQSHHSVVAESGNLYNACSSSPKFPNSLQDLESMRICGTTLDSGVGLPEIQPRFSLKSAMGADFDSYRLKASLRNLRESAGFSRNAFLQLCGMPCLGTGRRGVKIESLGSSSDSEGKEKVDHSGKSNDVELEKAFDDSVSCKGKQVRDDCDQKNESSAETDTMDLDDFSEKKPSGIIFSSFFISDLCDAFCDLLMLLYAFIKSQNILILLKLSLCATHVNYKVCF